MDNFIYNNELSKKLNLVSFASLINKIKLNNDPIPFLLKEFSEIESLFNMQNLTKILYFNKKSIHKILYDFDQIIPIKDNMNQNLSFNYYLSLLIVADPEIINYDFSKNYINLFNKIKKSGNQFFNLINSKIIIDLINNFKNSISYEENEDKDFIEKLEKENKENIKNNIYILEDIKLNLNEKDIYEKTVEMLYVDIIIGLIKNNKLCDFEYSYNIFKQLELENIDIQFCESKKLLDQIEEALNTNNEFIKNNIINNFNDINDINKINFHYFLLKYIFKNSFYIYNIPFLLESHKKIIKILKSKDYITFTITNQTYIDRINFIIQKYCDLDYYYHKEYLNKIKNKENNNITNIKSSILKKSKIIFDISINKKFYTEINKIECIYEEEKKINLDEMIKLQKNNNEYDNKSKLNVNFELFLNYLYTCKSIIENQKNNFQFNYNFKLFFEFINKSSNDNIFNINVEYNVQEHPFYKLDVGTSDENILIKKYNELEGLLSLLKRINFQLDLENDKFKETLLKSTVFKTKIIESIDTSIKGFDKIFTSYIIYDREIEYQILIFEKLIFRHEKSVKFFLALKNGYYFSCGNDAQMILYNEDFNELTKIKNFEDNLYNITEINNNEKSIELFASYGKYIYTINITKNNFETETKNYEVPNMKTLFCEKVNNNDYILGGIDCTMKIKDLFNYEKDEKKYSKIIDDFSTRNSLIINDKYIVLISNELIPNGANLLTICDLINENNKHYIKDYSFNLSENSMSLIKFEDGNNILLCACKKYKSNQSNGVLLVDINSLDEENIKYKYYLTNNFIPYCFCQLYSSIFIFIGGFNLDKRRGEINLYKIDNENINELIFVQNIEIIDDEYNNFYGIDMPINNIIQIKDSGKIIVTSINGYIFLFSKPNLDYYNKKHKG